MPLPLVHLRADRSRTGATLSVCSFITYRWTDEPQAVTCTRCEARIELAPA